jgi:hypothetical protein
VGAFVGQVFVGYQFQPLAFIPGDQLHVFGLDQLDELAPAQPAQDLAVEHPAVLAVVGVYEPPHPVRHRGPSRLAP